MEQTAVEWFYSQLIKYPLGDWEYFLKQAKAMENNQRLEDFKEGFQSAFDSLSSANNLVQKKTFKSE